MVNVLHHLPQVRFFFREAARCLQPGGILTMIEPWIKTWSYLVYSYLHSEACLPKKADWELSFTGPLSTANQALPWIIFHRDRVQFKREFPNLKVIKINLIMPFQYLFSGGVSLRSLAPSWSIGKIQAIERSLQPWISYLAMFASITLENYP